MNQADFSVVVLAAGQGTRMRSDTHKVLHPIAGRPMLMHLLATVEAMGAGRSVVVVGKGREQLEKAGMIFSGTTPDGSLVEIIEIPDHPYFIAAQFHPELKSRPHRPHPMFYGLVRAAKLVKHTQSSPAHRASA